MALPRLAVAAGCEYDRLGAKDDEASGLTPIRDCACDAIAISEQTDDGALHEDVDALMDAALLQRANHLEPGAIADVREALPGVTTEGALKNSAVSRAVEHRAPVFELADAIGRFLRMKLCHPPVVQELAAFHRVAEMRLPVVLRIDVRQRGCDAAL